MKAEENMHCNFCPHGIYDKKDEKIDVRIGDKLVTHILHKCIVCGGEIMKGINKYEN